MYVYNVSAGYYSVKESRLVHLRSFFDLINMKRRLILILSDMLVCTLIVCNVFSQHVENVGNVEGSKNEQQSKPKFFSDKSIGIGGWIDAQYQFEKTASGKVSAFQIRRARLDFKGSLSKMIDFRLQCDFAPNPRLIDAFVKLKFCKYANLQVGQFKIPFSLENKLSPLDLELTDNAQVISALSGYKDVTGISSYANGREIGLMLSGVLAEANVCGDKTKILSYELGVFGGNGINVKTDNMAKDLSARVEFCPFVRNLILSVSGYWGKYDMVYNNASTGTDGLRHRYAAGVQYSDEHLMLRGEYLQGRTDFTVLDEESGNLFVNPMQSRGFYFVAGYWFKFGWGEKSDVQQRLRPVLRVDYYEKSISVNSPSLYCSAGVDWWPEKHLRFQINYTLRQNISTGTLGHNLTTMLSVKF